MAKSKKPQKALANQPQAANPTQPTTQAAFLACGRCGYFLTGYKILQADWQTAVDNPIEQTLNLKWNREVRDLLAKTYGIELDRGEDYFSGRCSECWRPFSFEQTLGESGLTGHLQIKA